MLSADPDTLTAHDIASGATWADLLLPLSKLRQARRRRIVECLNLRTGDRNSYGSCVHEFRTAKLRRGSRTFAHDQVR
jgi:hypothetical protein